MVSLVLITGCGQHPGTPKITSLTNEINFSPAMSTTEMTDFATRYANAWSSQQPANVAAFFSTDGTLQVNDDAPAIGREAITAVARGFMTAFPDMVVSMDSLVNTPGGTEFHWTLTGTNSGPGGTGNKVKVSGMEVWTFSTMTIYKNPLAASTPTNITAS